MRLPLAVFVSLAASAQAYWLMGIENFITTERIDPVVSPGRVAGHVHSVLGGSNFGFDVNTEDLRQSECTSIPIPEDKSNYWFPHLYFQWANGSFTSLNGGAVIYYLFDDKPGTTTAFPDNFRMLSGDPTLRTYDSNSHAQQAITFLCLDFDGVTSRHNELPAKSCPSGIRAQINFPSCWDGKNVDSPDHKSHVAFLSGGPDSGTCSDPKFPVTLPRIFIEVYWASNEFEKMKSQAMNPSQPFVYAHGDPTGYGYHADFINGWEKGVLQNAVDKCHCDIYGSPKCCVDQGIFHMNEGKNCRITKSINEETTGTLPKLPGNNPVQPEGTRATIFPDTSVPELIAPVYAYTGNSPLQIGSILPGDAPRPTTLVKPSLTSAPGYSSSSAPSPSQPPSDAASSVPAPSFSTVVESHTSALASTSVQSTIPAPITSTAYGHDQPGISYPHATPSTTKNSFPTSFSIPSISIPSIPVPTFSMPHFPGAVPNNPNGHGGGNIYGGSNSGTGSGSSSPYYDYPSPNTPKGPNVPNGNGLINRPATVPSSSSPGAKPRRCPPRKRSTILETVIARDNFEEEGDNATGVELPRRLDRIRHSHRRRFANHAMN